MNYIILPDTFDWTDASASTPNSVWVIRYDFDLGGITAMMPLNVTLQFEGGVLSNGTLEGKNTKIEAPLTQIFETSLSLTKTFAYDTFYPEWYGAVGDGQTTDYDALSAACKNADHVTLTQTYHYYHLVEDSIIVDNKDTFTLIGYGSLLVNSDPGDKKVQAALFTFQDIKNLTVKGISINGNYKMAKGIKISDIPNATLRDINITNLRNTQADDNALGIDIRVINGSVIHGDNIRISEIDGGFDNAINTASGGLGIARALYIQVNYGPSNMLGDTENREAQKKTKITFDNSFFEWVYGDDGDVIDIIDEKFISNAFHRFIFTNCTIRYAFRRLVKGSASGIQYYNCKFDTAGLAVLLQKMGNPSPVDDDVKPSGGVNFRNANPDPVDGFPNFRNMHGKMINCEYRNSGNLDLGGGDTLIAAYTDGLEIRGCHFYDSFIRVQNIAGNFKISENTFHDSTINISSLDSWIDGRSFISNNTSYFFKPIITSKTAFVDAASNLSKLVIDGNKVYSKEDNFSIAFYGLFRHGKTNADLVADHVYISNNEIIRSGSGPRREYMVSNETWNASCKIYGNTVHLDDPANAGANFYNGVYVIGAPHWENYDGQGNLIGILM